MVHRNLAELVRCRGCGRLVRRVNAVLVEGSFYGRECLHRLLAGQGQGGEAEVVTDTLED